MKSDKALRYRILRAQVMANDNLKTAGRLDCVDQIKTSVNHKTALFSLFASFRRHITVLYAEKKTRRTRKLKTVTTRVTKYKTKSFKHD